jgi:calcium-dependent protein kinase
VLEDASHPHIMRIYELLHDDKFYFIVSEYIRGGELYDFIVQRANSEQGSLKESEVQTIIK